MLALISYLPFHTPVCMPGHLPNVCQYDVCVKYCLYEFYMNDLLTSSFLTPPLSIPLPGRPQVDGSLL